MLLSLLGVAEVIGWVVAASDGWKEMPVEELAAGDPLTL